MEMTAITKLVDDIEAYQKKVIEMDAIKQDLAERVVQLEAFLRDDGIEKEIGELDSVDDLKTYMTTDPVKFYRWVEELGIQCFDWFRMLEKAC